MVTAAQHIQTFFMAKPCSMWLGRMLPREFTCGYAHGREESRTLVHLKSPHTGGWGGILTQGFKNQHGIGAWAPVTTRVPQSTSVPVTAYSNVHPNC